MDRAWMLVWTFLDSMCFVDVLWYCTQDGKKLERGGIDDA
jgi:hypothetical protein